MVEYTYDAWGNILSVTGSLAGTIGHKNLLRYRGYYYDSETGLYYLVSRYYDSEIMRFLNLDTIIDNRGVITQNGFAYCRNNPVCNVDSTGHLFGIAIGGVIGGLCDFTTSWAVAIVGSAVIAAGCNVFNQYINYEIEKNDYEEMQEIDFGIDFDESIDTISDDVMDEIPEEFPSVGRFIAEWAMGTNVSLLQTSVEYIISIFEF